MKILLSRTPKDIDDMRGNFTFSISQIRSYVLGRAQYGRSLVESSTESTESSLVTSSGVVKEAVEPVDHEVVFKVRINIYIYIMFCIN